MAISYSKNDVRQIADSLKQAIDELGKVGAALDEVAESFKAAKPDAKWSAAIHQESTFIEEQADRLVNDLQSEVSRMQDSFNQLSVAMVNFAIQNADLEDDVISAIKGGLPDNVDGNIDNINPLGKES